MTVRYLSVKPAPFKFSRSMLCLLAVSTSAALAAEMTGFQGLGFLSEADGYSTTYGISADGSTVVVGSAIDGNGYNAEGAPEGWILDLTQIPELSSSALLSLAGVAMLRRRKR